MTVTSGTIDPLALALPAPFVNRFQLTKADATLVRLSFGEKLGTDATAYRAAVTMSAAAAQELALSILTILGKTSATPS
jgi:hypothetical protein